MLSSRGAVLVADTYTSAWSLDQIDSAQPLNALARAYATIHLNQGLEYKIQKITNLMEHYGPTDYSCTRTVAANRTRSVNTI